jgi:hypothetical protein
MSEIKESDVKEMLAAMAENLPDVERDALKDLLHRIVEPITLNLPELNLLYKFMLPTGDWWRPQGDSNPCTPP